ncbi:MAG: 5-(carboxyamino)imidazole ribonucleotide synthase [Acidimicrobiales bacterium]
MSVEPHGSALSRVGVVGGGQLARLLGEAERPGITLTVLAGADEPAVATCDEVVVGDARDDTALRALAERVDVITFDHELVDLAQLDRLEAEGVLLRPGPGALRAAVDKSYQRQLFAAAGLPLPRFVVVDSPHDARLTAFLDTVDATPVVKAARGGYDGRGVVFATGRDGALAAVGRLGGDVVVEERLALRGEAAQLLVRGADGQVVTYPLVTTVQREGQCVEVRYPCDAQHEDEAAALAVRVAELIGAVGVLAVEFFVTDAGLLINEVALRPHNTGHWTIEGARTSQFANHLAAVTGRPLGPTTPTAAHVVMVNVVGGPEPPPPDWSRPARRGDVAVHDYAKAWRPGRKLGHVTAWGDDATSPRVRAWREARGAGTASWEDA